MRRLKIRRLRMRKMKMKKMWWTIYLCLWIFNPHQLMWWHIQSSFMIIMMMWFSNHSHLLLLQNQAAILYDSEQSTQHLINLLPQGISLSPLHCQILRPRQNLKLKSIKKFHIILQFSYSLFTHLQHSSFTSVELHSASIICSTSSFPFYPTTSFFLSPSSHSDVDSSEIPEHFFMNLNTSFFLCHLTQYWRQHFLSFLNKTISMPNHPYPLHHNIMLPHDNAWNDSKTVQWWKLLTEPAASLILNLTALKQHFHL